MRSSRLPAVKMLSDFHFTFQPSIKREQFDSLRDLGFLERKENVIFLGPPGVEKATSPSGWRSPLCRRTQGLLRHAGRPHHLPRGGPGRFQARHRLKTLTHPALLVVDEIGYLPITRTGAMLCLQLMARRYETASTVLTSNKSFEEWGEIFGDDVMAGALIDRLLHHCHVVHIRGNSYRMRHHAELWTTLNSPAAAADEPPKQRHKTKERTVPAG